MFNFTAFTRYIIVTLIIYCAAISNASALNKLKGYEIKHINSNTNLILHFSKEFKYSVLQLSNPERLVFDIQDTIWQVEEPSKAYGPLVNKIRHGIQDGVNLRVVLDLNCQISAPKIHIDNHQRKMIVAFSAKSNIPSKTTALKKRDFDNNQLAANKGSRVRPVELKMPEPQLLNDDIIPVKKEEIKHSATMLALKSDQFMKKKSGKIVIVLDPGHGGQDPGTIGCCMKVQEKDITLEYAKALKRALEKGGRYKVVLTRNSDVFMYLSERMQKAKKVHANLFISIHADSNPNVKMRGASVYTVSEQASDKDSALLAKQENNADLYSNLKLSKSGHNEINQILIDLVHRETKNHSIQFANILIAEMNKNIPLINQAHRSAGFKVLKGIDVPAVLLELGYLSNKNEEALLSSVSYQSKLIRAISSAVDRHFR
jgi:N-acetylmuramoyl-L-alanine amidase